MTEKRKHSKKLASKHGAVQNNAVTYVTLLPDWDSQLGVQASSVIALVY